MDEFKPNPPKFNNEKREITPEKKVEKVISGTAKTKKKTGLTKMADVFIEDDVDSVKSYIVGDVIIPTIKKTIYDVITGSLDMFFFGGTGEGRTRSTAEKVSYRNYSSYSNKRNTRPNTRSVTGYSYDEVVLDSRGEAEEVLSRMDELVGMYGVVSVADFYDLVGVSCQYTDNKYGWTNIRNAQVMRVRDGYMIKLPKAMALD